MKMIFVFGSNLAGRHGAGAAKYAMEHHGAEYGVGSGATGDSYAIPTKGYNIENLSKEEIERHIDVFLNYARTNDDLVFYLTPVGCGLAGHSIAWLTKYLGKRKLPRNIVLSHSWINDYAYLLGE